MSDEQREPQKNRLRAAIVLYALEQALGSYVLENVADSSDLPVTQIKKFEIEGKLPPVDKIVQQTYISEILELAISVAGLASDKPHLKRLRDLGESLEIYDVRNAVCHPNRPFPAVYWYRLTAIATDPVVHILNLHEVSAAFDAAQSGKIENTSIPPDEWFKKLAFSLPNNLPDEIEHEITGLIGRSKEKRNLIQRLKNKRTNLISLVGPGGTGKTAIALDVLREIILEPKTLDWADEVVYITAKTERLTSDGPQAIENPIVSIEEARKSLIAALNQTNALNINLNDFSELKSSLCERRILICLDNLETILRDHSEVFEEFESELPDAWRLLVTSRVPVNSATNLPIDPMQSNAAAQLARDYMHKRGGDSLEFELFKQLAEKANCNPLAIRVTVDSVLSGMEIQEALKVTNDMILEFSYTNLIKNLPSVANRVLECLFATGGENQSRNEICFLLDAELDEVANGIFSLLKTSLITRHPRTDEESYSLSSSIRDLLLRNPLDNDTRTQVFNRLAEKKNVLSEIKHKEGSDPLDALYIDQNADGVFVPDVYKAFQAIRMKSSKSLLALHFEVIQKHLTSNKKSPLLFRCSAILLFELNDRGGATRMLEQAKINSAFDDAGKLVLAEYFKNEKRYPEALELGNELQLENWFDSPLVGRINLGRLARVSWLVSIWIGNAMEVSQEVKDWDADVEKRAIKGSIYVTAIRRLVEKETIENKLLSYFKEMLFCLNKIFQAHGYVGFVVAEAVNVLEEMNFKFKEQSIAPIVEEVAKFLNGHLSSICNVHKEIDTNTLFIKQLVEKVSNCKPETNLQSSKWDPEATDPVLEEHGFLPAQIYFRPKDMFGNFRNFLFAKDEDGIEYHVSVRAFNNASGFGSLQVGEKIMILPRRDYSDDGRARPVQDAVEIE